MATLWENAKQTLQKLINLPNNQTQKKTNIIPQDELDYIWNETPNTQNLNDSTRFFNLDNIKEEPLPTEKKQENPYKHFEQVKIDEPSRVRNIPLNKKELEEIEKKLDTTPLPIEKTKSADEKWLDTWNFNETTPISEKTKSADEKWLDKWDFNNKPTRTKLETKSFNNPIRINKQQLQRLSKSIETQNVLQFLTNPKPQERIKFLVSCIVKDKFKKEPKSIREALTEQGVTRINDRINELKEGIQKAKTRANQQTAGATFVNKSNNSRGRGSHNR